MYLLLTVHQHPSPLCPLASHPYHCTLQQLIPDHALPDGIRAEFHQLLQAYNSVFDRTISRYNGAVGPFKAVVNMGSVQPLQRKISRNKSVELQGSF